MNRACALNARLNTQFLNYMYMAKCRAESTEPTDDPAMTMILISPIGYSLDAHACYILKYLTAFYGLPAFSRSFPPLDSDDGILLLCLHG
jgi:hypothetical protein